MSTGSKPSGAAPSDLTAADVLQIARLARLRLDEEDVERLRHEMAAILAHFTALAQVVAEGVRPTAQVLDVEESGRGDTARPGLSRDDALAAAPDQDAGQFRVPRVLG
ncbi:MAG: Asp-tRNA(Asn)/Glu-tRNA(Gln) amidotransferase subunit GatC [Acidobacteriota bacterium]